MIYMIAKVLPELPGRFGSEVYDTREDALASWQYQVQGKLGFSLWSTRFPWYTTRLCSRVSLRRNQKDQAGEPCCRLLPMLYRPQSLSGNQALWLDQAW